MKQTARLVVLEGLQPAQDLFDWNLTARADIDLLAESVKLLSAPFALRLVS